jgi:hypothetical protein
MKTEYTRPLWVQISLEVVLAVATAFFAWYLDPGFFSALALTFILGRSLYLNEPPKLALRLRYPIAHWWPTKMGLRVFSVGALSGGMAFAFTRDFWLALACFTVLVVSLTMLPESADDEECEPVK